MNGTEKSDLSKTLANDSSWWARSWPADYISFMKQLGFEVTEHSEALRRSLQGAIFHFIGHGEFVSLEQARRTVEDPTEDERSALLHWAIVVCASHVRRTKVQEALSATSHEESRKLRARLAQHLKDASSRSSVRFDDGLDPDLLLGCCAVEALKLLQHVEA